MKKIILWVTVIMAVTAVFSYMEKQEETVLKAAYPQRMDIKNVLTINGTVKENNRKDIYLDEMAEIKEIYVKPGDYVEKGQLLARTGESEGFGITIPNEYVINAFLRGVAGEAVYFSTEDEYIRSPIDGTVMSINYKEGDNAPPIIPLISVSDLDDLMISAQINEDSIHKVKEGMSADIYCNIKDSEPMKGHIAAVMPYAVKTVNIMSVKENTAKTEVKIDISNKPYNIAPGNSVTIKLATDTKKDALIIPYEYIKQNENNEQYVHVLGEKGTPEIRIIETGYELETVCEVKNGIKEKDLLLMCNDGVNNPVKIKVKNADK